MNLSHRATLFYRNIFSRNFHPVRILWKGISLPAITLFFLLATPPFVSTPLAAEPASAKTGSAPFRIQLETDDVLIVEKYQDINIIRNGPQESREEKNRIVLKVIEKKDGLATLEGYFYTYSRSPRHTGQFRQEETFFSRFQMDEQGHYIVPDSFTMPNLQSLPTFPANTLEPGNTWTAPALETMDLDRIKIKIPLDVRYRFDGAVGPPPDETETLKKSGAMEDPGAQGTTPASTSTPSTASPTAALSQGGAANDFDLIRYAYRFRHVEQRAESPIRTVSASSTDSLWFDRNQGIPVYDRNRLVYSFLLPTGERVDYLYSIDSWYRKIRRTTEQEKKKIAGDLKQQLQDHRDLSVKENKEGVLLNMNDILFDTDSARLTEKSRKDLDAIAAILKKYPDREIRVMGHTDSKGTEKHNSNLSEERARTIANELSERYGIPASRISFRGYGESAPIASNSTAEGRSKNRRVEILIVME